MGQPTFHFAARGHCIKGEYYFKLQQKLIFLFYSCKP